MKRADLRLMREQLENVHVSLVAVEKQLSAASPQVTSALVDARGVLREQINRLPDAEANRHRLYPVATMAAADEGLANENRRLGSVAAVIPTDGSQLRS